MHCLLALLLETWKDQIIIITGMISVFLQFIHALNPRPHNISLLFPQELEDLRVVRDLGLSAVTVEVNAGIQSTFSLLFILMSAHTISTTNLPFNSIWQHFCLLIQKLFNIFLKAKYYDNQNISNHESNSNLRVEGLWRIVLFAIHLIPCSLRRPSCGRLCQRLPCSHILLRWSHHSDTIFLWRKRLMLLLLVAVDYSLS